MMGGPYGSEGYAEYQRKQEEARKKREEEAKAKREADAADLAIGSLDELDEEAQKVISWRLKNLLDAGFNYDHATLLANATHVDLHDAVSLYKKAGPVAYEILA